MIKTNVMKILEQKKIKYDFFEYDPATTDGMLVAASLNEDPNQVFKTLVTTDSANHYFVFVIPVNQTLDLKGVAKIVGKKSIDMIKQKELEPLTGYIHGGCSPIGMKKQFPLFIDESILKYDTIFFSAGRIGAQVEMTPTNLKKVINYRTLNLCKENHYD